MEEVLQEIRRLDLTVRDLLYFARPRKPEPETFPLRPLVEKIRSVLREEPVMQKVTVRCEFAPELSLRADPSQLEEVFMNLFLNAAQAMKQGGEILVGARAVDGRLELSVADQGEGIPAAIRGEIFRPFFSTKNRGSGLGLSIVRKVVEAHGGDLRVESAVGRGSTFTVSLPQERA
jgi:two-component system sensor histidine kinase HydH